jgi:DNA-binding MarR family transcriptional regulator
VAVSTQPTHGSLALLDHLARLSRLRATEALGSLGLRPRHLVALTLLRERKGPVFQQALAAELHIDSTNLVGLLNELEDASLVLRRRNSGDRRRHIVELTETGDRRLAEAERALAAVEAEVLAGLDIEQRQAFCDLLRLAVTSQIVDCGAAAAAPECDAE